MSNPNPSTSPRRFAVVGGGISGLTAAYRLQTLLPEGRVELFDTEQRLGGVLCTHREEDYLLECGADSFITKQPWARDLCDELGLADELIPTNGTDRRAWVMHRGELYPVPDGFFMMRPQKALPILGSKLLSWKAKMRLFAEPFVSPAADIENPSYDVSLAEFASHRLGQEAFDRLVEPLLAGIYTADATRLSVRATMPDALECVRQHGSLVKGMLWGQNTDKDSANRRASGARYGSFVTPRNGVSQLIASLESRLATEYVHRGKTVRGLQRGAGGQWTLSLADGTQQGPYAGVILALPTHAAGALLEPLDGKLSSLLGQIDYASSAIVCFSYKKSRLAKAVHGFGYVVPRVEHSPILACSYSSQKFPGRCPDDQIILRVFMGGALDPAAVDRDDTVLVSTARQAVEATVGATGLPLLTKVVRWRMRMPQYHVGHHERVEAIERQVALLPGLELAGNGYRGVGIPFCVHGGNQAATRLSQWHQSEVAAGIPSSHVAH